MLSPNARLQDRYHIVRHLGQGGMGAVYEAIDERVSAIVAVKETLIGGDEEARKAFRREAELLANLRHPSLPRVMDYFSEGESSFLVMDFIPGSDLLELLQLRGSPFPTEKVLAWADEILKVLQYLHERRVLHRDIKPSNLKLTKQGEIFLLDFGLAKGATGQMQTLLTSRSVFGYTPSYAPLEQIHGEGTDVSSDLYSLGATLYHLLTNVAPSDARKRDLDVGDEKPDPLRPLHELNPQVPRAVSAVIHQALATRRKGRPQSAEEMRRLLTEASRAAALEEEEKRRALDEQRRRREEAERKRERDEALRRSQEEEEKARRSREAAPVTPPVIEPTAPAVLPPRKATPPAKDSIAEPPIKTIPAPPPPPFRFIDKKDPSITHDDSDPTKSGWGRTKSLLAAAIVLALFVVAYYVWLRGTAGDNRTQIAAAANANANTSWALTSPPPGMIYVPGGEFTMGRDRSDGGDDYEHPAHEVTVRHFFMDVHEVTCEEFSKYLQGHTVTGNAAVRCAGRDGREPVTGVTWDDANAYAKWLGKRLPTEEEWEFAARGREGRRYPWGNEWKQGLANANGASKGLTKVGAHAGVSPYGALDMVGNAWEWTASGLAAYPGGRLPEQPAVDLKVIRGGSYVESTSQATTTYRGFLKARGDLYDKTGFRCVVDVDDGSVAK